MSAKVSGAVWDLELPHNEKLVLLAMADHADHNGNNVYPSLRLIAWKTDYDERQVRRIVDILETKGVLVVCERRLGHTTVYSINVQAVPQKSSFTAVRGRPRADGSRFQSVNKTPVTMSPVYDKPLTPNDKTLDIWDNKPLTSGTKTPDIFGACIYDAGASEFEPSLEPSIEPGKGRGADAPPPPAKQSQPKPYSDELTAFWKAYPPQGRARGSQSTTNEAWVSLPPSDQSAAMRGLTAALSNSQFVAYPLAPHRWLKQRRWETFLDGLPLDAPATGTPPAAPPRLYNPANDPKYRHPAAA